MLLYLDYTWGSPLFSQHKHTNTSLAPDKFTWVISGFENLQFRKKHEVFFWLLLKDRLSTAAQETSS
jgi:hypothetical protein